MSEERGISFTEEEADEIARRAAESFAVLYATYRLDRDEATQPMSDLQRLLFQAMAEAEVGDEASASASAAANTIIAEAADNATPTTLRDDLFVSLALLEAASDEERIDRATDVLVALTRVSLHETMAHMVAELEQLERHAVELSGTAAATSSATGDLTISPRSKRGSAGGPLALNEAPYAPVSSEFVFYETARALSQPQMWQREEATPWPTMSLDGEEAKGHIQLVPPSLDAQAFRSPEERSTLEAAMWRYRDGLSPRTRAVLRAVEILWRIRSRMSPTAPVVIGIDEILDAMGRVPKRGEGGRRSGHHADARRSVIEELAIIQAVQIRASVTMREKGKTVNKQVLARLFSMTVRGGQLQLDGTMDVQAVVVTPDSSYAHYLLTHAHMPYDTRLLAENPQTHGLVISLVEALYEDWRRNGGISRPRNYLGLLAETGTKPYAKPNREIERAEKVLAYIRAKGYADIDWSNANVSEAYGRGASRLLANAAVIAEPPEHIRAKYGRSTIGRRKAAAPAEIKPGSLAPRITAARLASGLTQAQAAENTGIPQQTFSRAERGLGLSDANRKKLERWLARVEPTMAAE